MTAQPPSTTPRPPRRPWHRSAPQPPARASRAGFALPTVRELPRRDVRDPATW